jgi:hypothetical protein
MAQIKALGGTDAHSVMFGNWNTYINTYNPYYAAGYDQGGDYSGLGVLSHYAYRLMPCTLGGDLVPCEPPSYDPDTRKGIRVLYIKPDKVMFTILTDGGPVFKTQKDLAGRAIVADSFGKNNSQPTIEPGDGYWGHRDGYNVLYGDWSAKWYGDPQQRLIWWNNDRVQAVYGNVWDPAGYNGGNHNIITDYDNSPSVNPPNYSAITTNTYIHGGCILKWHVLDAFAGIDVGVDAAGE